jgi:hypothetical protein
MDEGEETKTAFITTEGVRPEIAKQHKQDLLCEGVRKSWKKNPILELW